LHPKPTDAGALPGLIDAAAAALGPVGCLINNASIFEDDRVGSISGQSLDRAFGSNLEAPMMLTQAFAAQAPKAVPDAAGEPVAQANVINMIDQRVNGIGPGPTMRATKQSEAHFARQRAACVLGRGSDPEDILAAMRFILGCKALTGQMLAIDGGQHLAWQTPDIIGEDV